VSDTKDSTPELDSILERNLPAVRAYVRVRLGAKVGAHESTSDVVQSVCRELLEQRGDFRFQGEAALRGWLFTAALNKIQQRHRYWGAKKRDAAREAHKPGSDSDEDRSVLDVYAHLATPSREVAAREQLERFDRALAQLDERDREIVALAKIAGLPHAEIARLTNRSEEACRTALRRALIRLAELLDDGS
jgi:RNA polymerase sigma factor (sigma-70 family)